MRCRPRPGSRFYSLDRLPRRTECWEPLYDLITPPLRRGRNARKRSGVRHVFSPPPAIPPLESSSFSLFPGWAHPPSGCLNLHSLDFTFFSSFQTSRKLPRPLSSPEHGNPLDPLGVVYFSKQPSRPEPN